MSFYEDKEVGCYPLLEKSLLEAIEIEKGNIPLKKREKMPAPTYYIADSDSEMIDRLINIRKSENVSQAELAKKTGVSQQAISRLEQKTHSPSLKLFASILDALGYDVQLVKKEEAV